MSVIAPIVSTWDNSGVRKATKAFGGLTDSAKRSFGKIADAAKTTAIAVAGIGTAAAVGAYKAIDAASDLAETQSKVAQIFGDSNVAVEEFAKTAADSLGQTRTEALNAAADFATFGKAAGLGGDELADFSTELVTLSSDLASFYNTDPTEAANAIAAALRGESEPLRKYGVLLNDATLKQAALEMGIYDGEGALTAQQKVLAANRVVLEQTTDAQGDFARTADGLANSQRRLKARLGDTVTAIGTRLLPIALKITDFFLDKLVPAAELVGTVFGAAGIGGVFRLFAFLVESQLGRAVDFAGWLPEPQLHALIAAADVLVIPSLYEPFGLVALEGAALGTPLVVARTGGLAEFVEDGTTGRTFAPGDVADLTRAVSAAIMDPSGSARMARKAKALLRDAYGWTVLADEVASVYERAMRSAGPGEVPAVRIPDRAVNLLHS